MGDRGRAVSAVPQPVVYVRDPGPYEIRARAAKHWKGKHGHCSIWNKDEEGRRGARIGVRLSVRGLTAKHWICPECARAIAKVVP